MRILKYCLKRVAHGCDAPHGWRKAWCEPRRRVDVYSPVPLQWILRLARELVYRLHVAIAAPGREAAETLDVQRCFQERERLADEYSRGYLAGWRECFQACLAAVDELTANDDVWTVGTRVPDPSAAKQGN